MGRPREHDEQTRAALRAAAERLVATGGPEALTVRAVAEEVGTTTRAIYSIFGSKEALVSTLAEQAFELLRTGIDELPETDDPAGDLIEAGATMYRGFVREHPSLFRIAFQRIAPELTLGPELSDVRARSWARLEAKVRRLEDAGLLGGLTVNEAAVAFNALCEGLANAELRGGTLRQLPAGQEERVWRDAFAVLVHGFNTPRPQGTRRTQAPRRGSPARHSNS
jgi:AcrR family transcriptional regulator